MTYSRQVDAAIAARQSALSDWCAHIFDLAEPAWREYRSAAWYVERLRAEGFEVEAGSGGMPTAFAARWSNGDGAQVGMYAEYDAVPANCQAADTLERPRDGLGALAPGHTDPHSALGIGALGGLLATKAVMQQEGIPGTLRFTGEPAEKVRGSKPLHAAKGYYDGLDAMLSFHPFYMLPLCNTVRLDTHCGAAYSMIFRFICDAPEAWNAARGAPIPQAHSDIRAPGATDAVVMMYQNARAIRDAMLPHRGGWSISEAILNAGQATADNLPGRQADIQYMIRTPDIAMAEAAAAALMRVAGHVAEMTGSRFERHWVSKSRPGLANLALARAVWSAMKEAGPPRWGQDAVDIAKELMASVGELPVDDPFLPATENLTVPDEAEAILRQELPPSQVNSTSDDYTEMCWHAPTARFYVARPTLAARPGGGAWPAWVMNALGGIRATIDPTVVASARILGRAALRVLTDEGLRHAAGAEFEKRTGGGVGGSNWTAPLADYPPPTGFSWPEYVETPRGRDWWIPSI